MAKFLTVKEAADLTGKSKTSIRRIIYPIVENDKHPDRSQIEPTIEQVKALRIKGENFAWKITEKLLRSKISEGDRKDPSPSKSARIDDGSATLIELLRGELEIKNQQIAALNETTNSLAERLREGNVLMNSLQQQLALTDGSARNKSSVVEVETSSVSEKGSESTKETPKKTHWLFRNRKLF